MNGAFSGQGLVGDVEELMFCIAQQEVFQGEILRQVQQKRDKNIAQRNFKSRYAHSAEIANSDEDKCEESETLQDKKAHDPDISKPVRIAKRKKPRLIF